MLDNAWHWLGDTWARYPWLGTERALLVLLELSKIFRVSQPAAGYLTLAPGEWYQGKLTRQ
ncbi:MAG TPA: hypothetical protein VFV38_33980 [Ktedonobacteraceae bacterium]|nr:hypothetical protein [Ktedonobacteraceae bacterium]